MAPLGALAREFLDPTEIGVRRIFDLQAHTGLDHVGVLAQAGWVARHVGLEQETRSIRPADSHDYASAEGEIGVGFDEEPAR
jgi:hypothetical protein